MNLLTARVKASFSNLRAKCRSETALLVEISPPSTKLPSDSLSVEALGLRPRESDEKFELVVETVSIVPLSGSGAAPILPFVPHWE